MAETYNDELLENYDSLRKDRDWSVAAMADSIETQDPALAAQYRERFVSNAEPKAAPAKRRSKADAEQNEG